MTIGEIIKKLEKIEIEAISFCEAIQNPSSSFRDDIIKVLTAKWIADMLDAQKGNVMWGDNTSVPYKSCEIK